MSFEKRLDIINLGGCAAPTTELLGTIVSSNAYGRAVYVCNMPEKEVETLMYAVIGRSWECSQHVSVVAGCDWIFIEKIQEDDNRLARYKINDEVSEERKKRILEFYGL
nr:MAG TPA: hypothetical protein [Bacteriophage sp.]